jgi:hypothetical protein
MPETLRSWLDLDATDRRRFRLGRTALPRRGPFRLPYRQPHDAKLIEAAVGVLPLYYHTLLKAWYVRRLEPGKCLAVAAKVAVPVRKRIPFDAFDGELEAAYVLLLDALELPAVIRKQRAKDLVRERLA